MHTSSRPLLIAAAALLAAVLVGCASDPAPAPDESGPVTAEPMAPTPYTADQIREGNPAGTFLVFRIETTDAPVMQRWMQFVSTDAEGAVVEGGVQDERGAAIGATERQESTWQELRDHAAFPEAKTTRSEVTCEVRSGRFECWLYTVETEEEGAVVTSRFYFAKDRPGPPVLVVTEGDAATMRMELIEDSRGG
jgi:hypothetical protein